MLPYMDSASLPETLRVSPFPTGLEATWVGLTRYSVLLDPRSSEFLFGVKAEPCTAPRGISCKFS